MNLVGEIEVEQDLFAIYLSGRVRNTTNRTYTYAQITFNVYDSEGAQIGTAMDNINNWEAGGTWRFKAMFFGDSTDAASYKLADITAF